MNNSNLIVNFCPTGMVPTKKDTPHVPISANEIIEQVVEAWEIGITIAHLHARDENGRPDWRPETHYPFVEGIRKHCPGLVICLSTSGRDVSEFERRSAVIEMKPDMCSLTLGSINFLTQASVNSPDMIIRLFEKMLAFGVLPEFECFTTGMINFGNYLKTKYKSPKLPYWNILCGNINGLQPELLEIATALSLIDKNEFIAIGGLGKFQLMSTSIAIAAGVGVRIGLEDSIHYRGKERLATNTELLLRVHELMKVNDKQLLQPEAFRALAGMV